MAFRVRLIGFFLLLTCSAYGQGYLMQEIQWQETAGKQVREVLEAVGEARGFYFSYNTHAVPGDSTVVIAPYRGKLLGFLEKLLGQAYEFKESPGYVIIRYAPWEMAVSLHVEKRRLGPLVVEGQVNDRLTGAGVPLASIYERHALVSTLSDRDGGFRLSITRPDETLWLTISKEHYRDTTLALISPVRIRSGDGKIREWFYPENVTGGGLESSAIGRFFAGSRQRIQALNLGGFFTYNPFQVSLTPGLSSQGMLGGQLVNRMSLNVLGGRTAGVDGVEVAGVFNVNQSDVRYLQAAGLLNIVGHNVSGFQVAGLGNTVLNNARGMQVGGLFNSAADVRGVQLSGVVNVADKVHGVQITSLINVADSSDYPIGLINLVKQGRKSLAVGMDETGLAQLTFRSGGRVLYGLIGAGHYLNSNVLPYAAEAGLGARLVRYRAFALDAELASRIRVDFKGETAQQHALRLLPNASIGRYFVLVAGPTASYGKKWAVGIYGALVVPLS